MRLKVFYGFRIWRDRFDVLGLDVFHHVDDIFGRVFNDRQDRWQKLIRMQGALLSRGT